MRAITNKKGLYNYEILEMFEAGLKLLGTEAKSLRAGMVSFKGAYVTFREGEAYVVNLTIPAYQPDNAPSEYEPERPRKLLLHKKELDYLRGKESEQGLTVIPVKLYTAGARIKLAVGVARRKKKHDKRAVLKKKAHERDVQRELSDKNL